MDENTSNLIKHIGKQFFQLFAGNVISQIIFFYGILIAAQHLHPEQFGVLSFSQSITLFFIRFSEFGQDTYCIRRIASGEPHPLVVTENILSKLISSVFVFIVGSCFLFMLPVSRETSIFSIICMLSLFGNAISLEWYFQAVEKMIVVGVARFIRAVCFTIPLILLPSVSLDLSVITYSFLSSFIVPSIFLLIWYSIRNRFLSLTVIIAKNSFNRLKESAPLGAAAILMQIPFNIGTIIISIIIGLEAAGVYSAGYRIAVVLWSFGIVALYNAMYQSMVKLSAQNELYEELIKKITLLSSLSGIIVVISGFLFAQTIIDIFYDGKYSNSVSILQYSFPVIGIVLSRVGLEYSLLVFGKNKEYLQGMVYVSVCYSVLGVLGVEYFGIEGMLLAAFISEVVYTIYILLNYRNRETRKTVTLIWIKAVLLVLCISSIYIISLKYGTEYSTFIVFSTMVVSIIVFFQFEIGEILNKMYKLKGLE